VVVSFPSGFPTTFLKYPQPVSSLNVRHQFSPPYKTTGKVISEYFNFYVFTHEENTKASELNGS
jgi:hypothetical protein